MQIYHEFSVTGFESTVCGKAEMLEAYINRPHSKAIMYILTES